MIRLVLALLLLPLAACAAVPAEPGREQKRIAITFDDVPRAPGAFLTASERTDRLLAALKEARVAQAAFFVTSGNLDGPGGEGGEARIGKYTAAGHVIANHSHTHRHLSRISAQDYVDDIDYAEGWLANRPNRRPWFRFPFLDEGGEDKARRDAVRRMLANRGLRNGYVTVDASDWHMESLTIDARNASKPIDIAALRDLYVESHVEAADFYDGLARAALGRSPAHVLLLHETDLAALWVDDLVAALRARGWRIVTADEAYADPLGALLPDVPSAQGTLTEAIAWEKGLPAPRWYARNDTKLASRLFAERVLKETPAP